MGRRFSGPKISLNHRIGGVYSLFYFQCLPKILFHLLFGTSHLRVIWGPISKGIQPLTEPRWMYCPGIWPSAVIGSGKMAFQLSYYPSPAEPGNPWLA